MPEFLEKKLKAEYGQNSKIPYRVMNKIGAMRGNKETAKGEEMQAKHDRDKQHADMKKYRGKSTTYDHNRPKRQVVTRYSR